MGDNGEKKTSVYKERFFDILCLAASYGILFLLPQKVGWLFYLVFGMSAFLYCIGFFRLGLTFDSPSDLNGELAAGLSQAVTGILLNAVGIYLIWRGQGSGRSIMIATLLLIQALVLYAMAGSRSEIPGYQRLSATVFRGAAVLLVIFGAVFVIVKNFNEVSVIIAAMLLIESICLWKMGSGSNPVNDMNSEILTVPGLRIPISQLQQAFAGVQTQLGYPWIGKVETIKQDAVIYGPSEDGFVVYGYYLFGRFYVAGSTNPLFPDPEDAQEHTVAETPDKNGVLLCQEDLAAAYADMFTRYLESGNAQWIADYPEQPAI